MKELVFATNNEHKLAELRQILGSRFRILSLADINCHDDIPEDYDTLQENSLAKARWIKEKYGYDCFADDTGLMVDALNGEPGVRSARYAGDGHDSEANVRLLLKNLEGQPTERRTAHFTTVITLLLDGKQHSFVGEVHGHITEERSGQGGFGYDPVFMPDGWDETFAQASSEKKNSVSHRGRAVAKLIEYLSKTDK